jgi:hypothetical protein
MGGMCTWAGTLLGYFSWPEAAMLARVLVIQWPISPSELSPACSELVSSFS